MLTRMSWFRKAIAAAITAAVLVITIWALAREISYRVERERRHHQIGQVWTFCRLYYCPKHNGHFPYDLDELRQVPEYAAASAYWGRALSEIELTTPGVATNGNGGGSVVVLREKKADRRGARAFHETNGCYGFTNTDGTSVPKTPSKVFGD